jgi:predicted RNA binding protein YcfA (HicA-like mRNA interferase family)
MKLPSLKSKDVIKVLKKLGYFKIRQTSGHEIFYHSAKKKIIPIPIHNKDLKRGLVRAIIRELEISRDEFIKLLK